ncbi:ABC transporter permease, partial [Vibrio anguillarum]|nr:ABC transporter permease [Vibrio anguillarum]
IQLGFWATPIFWNITMVPIEYQWVLKLNPVFYITEGYRNTITTDLWFWESFLWTAYYWIFTSFTLLVGIVCFKKLRPHFADVL